MSASCLGGILLVLATACSNPKCWTHDSDEVSGGCSAFGDGESRGGGGGHGRSWEDVVREAKAGAATMSGPCAQGNGLACAVLAGHLSTLHAPAAERESANAAACMLGVASIPYKNTPTCGEAGNLALRRGDTVRAIELYQKACALGDTLSCESALPVAPRAIEPALALCQLEKKCAPLAGIYAADPLSAPQARAVAAKGCRHGDRDACLLLGREASRP